MELGILRNELIANTQPQYSLKNKICPTFQNEGTATCYIDGRTLKAGESYSVNAPNIVLQNQIAITFEADPSKTKILYVGYVELKS
jgi:hypothetical protein